MLPTFVNKRVTGAERGDFYALDLGGWLTLTLTLTLALNPNPSPSPNPNPNPNQAPTSACFA